MRLFTSKETFQPKKDPPRVARIKGVLDSLRDGELLTTAQLAMRAGTCTSQPLSDSVYLADYFYTYRHLRYWGKPITIKELISQCQKSQKSSPLS